MAQGPWREGKDDDAGLEIQVVDLFAITIWNRSKKGGSRWILVAQVT
jgi:hypothetical protein